jgi:hypothetical protein
MEDILSIKRDHSRRQRNRVLSAPPPASKIGRLSALSRNVCDRAGRRPDDVLELTDPVAVEPVPDRSLADPVPP